MRGVQHDAALQTLTLTVADTGTGIPAEFRTKLFHTVGLTTTNTDYLGGSGLGLNICKCLVDNLGGSIMFRDNEPRGTVMTVTLPTAVELVPAAQVASADPADMWGNHYRASALYAQKSVSDKEARLSSLSEGSEASGPGTDCAGQADTTALDHLLHSTRVLVAEDNRINQKVLSRMLIHDCLELHRVNNGEQAVAEFAAAGADSLGDSYGIVVLDVHMPVMGGKEAAKLIRSRDPDVPLIFLTGEHVQQCSVGLRLCLCNTYHSFDAQSGRC